VRRLLLLAATTGYQIRSFREAVEKVGVRLVFATDRCDRLEDPWWDAAIPVRFHDLPSSLAAVIAECGGDPPAGVLAVGDRPTVLAAHVSAAFGLPGNPPEAAQASRNKLAARRAFASAGLLTPEFEVLSLSSLPASLPGVPYPVVVKPLALSGSRGVIRADDEPALVSAIERVSRLLRTIDVAIERDPAHEHILVETFIPGAEYAVEGVLTGGALTAFAIFDKPDPLDGPFFEETLYVTPSRASRELEQAIVTAVTRAARALGLHHGPVHAECRANDRGVYVLEVAARPIGGLCSKAVVLQAPDGAAVSLEEVLVRHATGERVEGYAQLDRATGVMMIPIPRRGIFRGVAGIDQARQVAGIDDVRITAKPDSLLIPLPEGRSYLGFIFASGERADSVEEALRRAHTTLEFAIEREVTLAP
jgi:D-alanine-D-alanine ligase-like ATP-grasp enzyme